MKRQAFQRGEIRDENDNIISEGAYGKKTAFANKTNDGILDYIVNNFQALFDMISGAYVYVDTLPSSGDSDKLYVVNSTGKTYRWDGKQFVFVSEPVDGLSAYEIAKQNGFEGTEQEWLESIKCRATEATVDENGYLILKFKDGTTIKTALQPLIETKQYADSASKSAGDAAQSAIKSQTSAANAEASRGNAATAANDAEQSRAAAKKSAENCKEYYENMKVNSGKPYFYLDNENNICIKYNIDTEATEG